MLTSCQTHQRILVEAPAFEGQTQEIQLMPCTKNHKSWCSPKKNGLHHLNHWPPKLIKRVRSTVFWCDFSFGAGLFFGVNSNRSVSWKTPTFLYLFMWVKQWDDLKNDMIFLCHEWKYVLCIFRSLKDMATSKDQTKHLRNWPNSTRCCQDSASCGSCIAYHYMHQLGIHLMRKYTSVYLSRSLQKCSGFNLVSTNTLNQA